MKKWWMLTPVVCSISCTELAKVVLEELEEQLEDVYVPNDGNFNGISDNHESIISITKSAYPVNRSDIYGDTDHVFCGIDINRDIQCIHDFMSVTDPSLLTNQNSKTLPGYFQSLTKIRGWTADERTSPASFYPFVAALEEGGDVYTDYWGPPEDNFWALSGGRHLYVEHGFYDYNANENIQITLQNNDISIVFEGDDDTMTLLNDRYLRQIDQLHGGYYNQMFSGVDELGDPVFESISSMNFGLPSFLVNEPVLQTAFFETRQNNVRLVQAVITRNNDLVLWQNDDLQYGPQPEILFDFEQISASGPRVEGNSNVPGYICGVRSDASLDCIELVYDEVVFDYVWDYKLVPSGNFLQVTVENDLICGIHTDGRVECWYHDLPQESVIIPGFTSIGF